MCLRIAIQYVAKLDIQNSVVFGDVCLDCLIYDSIATLGLDAIDA